MGVLGEVHTLWPPSAPSHRKSVTGRSHKTAVYTRVVRTVACSELFHVLITLI